VNSDRKTHEQDVVAAKNQLSVLKADYMSEITAFLDLANDARKERLAALLRCQQKGNAYFNYAEEFVGNSDLLGAHGSALWAQGFAEDCAEILKSLPGHIEFLITAFKSAQVDFTLDQIIPGSTAYANMQRMVVKYLTLSERNRIAELLENAGLPVYGFKNEAKEFMSRKLQTILSFVFGVVFVLVMLVISFLRPEPSTFQYGVFRTVLALAGAGAVGVFPGFIEVKFGNWLRAGGALAVFAILYFFNPAQLTAPSPAPKVTLSQPPSSAP
jgi:hypothetical protein